MNRVRPHGGLNPGPWKRTIGNPVIHRALYPFTHHPVAPIQTHHRRYPGLWTYGWCYWDGTLLITRRQYSEAILGESESSSVMRLPILEKCGLQGLGRTSGRRLSTAQLRKKTQFVDNLRAGSILPVV